MSVYATCLSNARYCCSVSTTDCGEDVGIVGIYYTRHDSQIERGAIKICLHVAVLY